MKVAPPPVNVPVLAIPPLKTQFPVAVTADVSQESEDVTNPTKVETPVPSLSVKKPLFVVAPFTVKFPVPPNVNKSKAFVTVRFPLSVRLRLPLV